MSDAKLKKILRRCAGALAAVTLLCGLAAAAPKEMNVTYVQAPLNIPSIVEKSLGIFAAAYKKFGLPVGYANLTAGPEQTAALASGDIQILNAVGGTSVIIAVANGADVKIISMYSRSPKAFMLLSNDSSLDSPASLKGKIIAGPKGTNLHELLVAYLRAGGMTLNDVQFVNMGIPAALSALESGAVDAALLAGPAAYNSLKSGKHLVTTGEGLTAALIATATSQKFYDENRELVQTFEAAQKDVLDFMKEHRDEAMKMTAEATGLEISAVDEMSEMYDFSPEITARDRADFEKTQQFLLDNDMIESKIEVKDLFLKR